MRIGRWILMLLVLLAVNAGAQQTVQLPGGMMRLDSLLNKVSRQTHQHFSLNTKKVVPATTVNWKAGKYTLEQFLQKLCATYAIAYSRSGQHIILREVPKKATTVTKPAPVAAKTTPVKPKTAAAKPVAKSKTSTPATTLPVKPVAVVPDKKDTIVASPPSAITMGNEPEDKKFLPVTKEPDTLRKAAEPVTDTVAKTKIKRRGSGEWKRLLVQTGLAVDDLFYTGPTLKGGFRIAYGILSWNSNFKIAGFRYGGGTSLRISDDMRLHAEVTFGKLARDYDTAGQARTVKTRLTRVQLLFENRIAGKFYLQYGPILNLLKTEYYLAGMPWPLNRSEEEADSKFHYLKPIYTLRNTYRHDTRSNNKMWIGAQIGIYYHFK